MAAGIKFDSLPTVPNAQLTDIICADVSNVSSKETLQQLSNLFEESLTKLGGITGIISAPTGIIDADGNPVLYFSYTDNAVNYLTITNSITAETPMLSSAGTDSNVDIQYKAKGNASHIFYSPGATDVISFVPNSGSSSDIATFGFPTLTADRTYTFPDSTGTVALTSDIGQFIYSINVVVPAASLATGGSVTLINSSGSDQYQILDIKLNSGGTNFSGGGGDRLGQITDGTTVYSVIPAATMQSLVNAGWGISAALPFPASAAIAQLTVAGTDLVFKYSGGSTDYSTGSLVITLLIARN